MIARALTMLPDERLAQLAAAGSDPAFSALYNRYSGTLFAYCRSITRNADDGWDALQNAMIKVLVALRRSPDRSSPVRPWLYCICHNEAVGILRRRAAAERVAHTAGWITAAGADEQALEREQVREVVSDVQQLPQDQAGGGKQPDSAPARAQADCNGGAGNTSTTARDVSFNRRDAGPTSTQTRPTADAPR